MNFSRTSEHRTHNDPGFLAPYTLLLINKDGFA
jgi:hypothetical protein